MRHKSADISQQPALWWLYKDTNLAKHNVVSENIPLLAVTRDNSGRLVDSPSR